MGGVRRKKSRKNATINILRKKNKKKVIKIGDKTMAKHWDHTKTVQQNMQKLGLAYDSNTSMQPKKKKGRKLLDDDDGMDVENIPEVDTEASGEVITEFEKQAASGKKHERHVSPDEAKFLLGLMKTHKSDYSKMSKDKRNTYQHTANQLRHKCEGLLSSSLLPKYKEMFPDLVMEDMET